MAHQAPLSMGFSREEYWSGLPCPSPGDLPDPGIKPTSLTSPALAGKFFTTITTCETFLQKWGRNKAFLRQTKVREFVTSRPLLGFPGGDSGKESACNAGISGSIPGWGRPPGEGKGNPLQCSCLGNPIDRGAWQATVHGVAKSLTWLSTHVLSFA